ncbi:3'(2'),5'-bisphosphate nucleotidase CysQ [Falsiroseomonas sp. HC035]|uniref:3'(2'),5'-bisphosphate nucleotidase CysQ n=1 Tax=Falsiroseomonas sp. HC035 TaxID=3390999 RepID=UPI003D31FF5E
MTDHTALLALFAAIAARAGHRIVEIRARPHDVTAKSDGSPLTEADLAAEAIIAEALPAAAPGIAVVSEEDAARPAPPEGAAFILVDPLDGTREFLGPSGEFTVNIALIEAGRPVCGVVYAPALSRIWRGARGTGAAMASLPPGADPSQAAWRQIHARPRPAADWTAVASRSHLDAETQAFLAGLPVGEHRAIGSSLKFCLLAEGVADVYPRFGPTMEWDTAAGQAVLEAAGGRVETPAGGPFTYGKSSQGFRNGAFVAWGATAPTSPVVSVQPAEVQHG